MVSDWTTNQNLIKKWLDAVGCKEHPLGDAYREVVLNPTILSCMLCVCLEDHPEEKGYWNPLSLTEKLASAVREALSRPGRPADEVMRDWYSRLPDEEPLHLLSGKNVLDLGAGEGYLGRWLNSLGMNYSGVDVSKPLVEEGNTRFNSLKRKKLTPAGTHFELALGNLEDPDTSLVGIKEGTQAPDFVLFACSLEHVAQPQKIIQALANYLATREADARVLVAVSNPDYHLADGLNDASCFNVENKVQIASIGEQVTVVIRPWFEYVRMFRAAHFRCERLFLTYLPHAVAKLLPHVIDQKMVDIAPFYLFQFRLHTHRLSDPQEECIKSAIDMSILNCASPEQKQQLVNSRNDCKVYTFPPDARMFERHDVAGHLWIVLDGSAKLVDTDIAFARGDSIGELEIGREQQFNPIFFRYGCRSGSDGCVVLNIPPDVISRMMQSETGISGGLFSQITKKLRSQVWLWNLPLTKLSGSEIIEKHAGYLPKCAAALVWACQIAADFGNCSVLPGDVAFLSLEEIRRKVFPALKPDPDELRGACYLLVALGIVDAFPGGYLRERARNSPELAKRLEKLVVTIGNYAVGSFIQPADKDSLGRIAGKLKGIVSFDRMLWSKMMRSDVFDEELGIGITSTLRSVAAHRKIDLAVLKNQFDCAYGYLQHTSRWLFEGTPSFFVVREPQMLRAIAVSDTSVGPMLDSRAKVLGVQLSSRNSAFDAAKDERLIRYVSLFEKFVIQDLQSERRNLHFTGAPDRNHETETMERKKRRIGKSNDEKSHGKDREAELHEDDSY